MTMPRANDEKKPLYLKGFGFDETIHISDSERKFCELLATGQHNKTSARLEAGYPDLSLTAKTPAAKKNANASAAYKLAKKTEIMKYCDFLSSRNMRRLSLTTEDLLATSAAIHNASILDLVHPDGSVKRPHEIDPITARAIKKVKPIYYEGKLLGYEYEFYDKLACQRNLIQLQEMQLFKQRLSAKMKGRKLELTRGGNGTTTH